MKTLFETLEAACKAFNDDAAILTDAALLQPIEDAALAILAVWRSKPTDSGQRRVAEALAGYLSAGLAGADGRRGETEDLWSAMARAALYPLPVRARFPEVARFLGVRPVCSLEQVAEVETIFGELDGHEHSAIRRPPLDDLCPALALA